jgi:hypothetical protein
MRQQLELRRAAAHKCYDEAQHRLEIVHAAQKLCELVVIAKTTHRMQEAEIERTRASLATATAQLEAFEKQLRKLDHLERVLEDRAADDQIEMAQTALERVAALRSRLESAIGERNSCQDWRRSFAVPNSDTLSAMRRLATDLAKARGALDVGFLVTVTPRRRLDIRVQKDDAAPDSGLREQPLEVEVNAQAEVDVVDIVTVRVTGGRRETQRTARILEERWSKEVVPHLAAANVSELEGLDAKIEQVREVDSRIQAREAEIASLREQLEALPNSDETLRAAMDRKRTTDAALSGVARDTVMDDLRQLGADPIPALRQRQEQTKTYLEAAREVVSRENSAHTIAEERGRSSKAALDSAIVNLDAAAQAFPQGLPTALVDAQKALAAAVEEQHKVSDDLVSLNSCVAAEHERLEAAVNDARTAIETARRQVESARGELTDAIAEHASQVGRLNELRRLRDAEDLPAAECRLQLAIECLAALPVPDRVVSEAEVIAERDVLVRAKSDLAMIEREIQKTHGALEQVGGAVVRERLRDAFEAFEMAERQEREIEVDYEAWKLLLEQMKEADAAQASNLGQALAPAIASKFEALTVKRYEGVRLTAELCAEGVVAEGAVRPAAKLSVGTREQLSTLYRLALAEYLRTVVVLDDQLVQSDGSRMEWFRALLAEKARSFQIVVFTCRPRDYLSASSMVSEGDAVHSDSDGEFVRGIDLGRALRRH